MRYRLTAPYRDGATHIVLEPVDFMARLAALVAPPRERGGEDATVASLGTQAPQPGRSGTLGGGRRGRVISVPRRS